MLKPSYSELMDVLNLNSGMDKQVTSSYAIVIAASKRARQLINGAMPLAGAATDKAVSVAVNEIREGHIHLTSETEAGKACEEACVLTPEENAETCPEAEDEDNIKAGFDDAPDAEEC